jgi:sugar-specific transcriptional regulator TrmB
MAILQKGPATATEIANCSDVSKRHVYNIARKLEDREFVIINDYLSPTTIEPAPPESVYERLQEEARNVYQKLESLHQSSEEQRSDIKVLKSRVTVLKKIQNLISSATERIAMCIPADFVPKLRDPLREAVENGVTVILLLFENPMNEGNSPDIPLEGLAHVIRYRENEVPVLFAVDRESALVSQRGVITQPNSQVNAIFMVKSYLESVVFSSMINSSWIIADQIYTRSPDPLPAQYTNFRQAVINAALHRQEDTDLSVTLEARPSRETAEITELTGEIVDIKQRLVEPIADARPGQCCLHVDVGSETVTVGGKDAHIEDYSTYSTTLERAR